MSDYEEVVSLVADISEFTKNLQNSGKIWGDTLSQYEELARTSFSNISTSIFDPFLKNWVKGVKDTFQAVADEHEAAIQTWLAREESKAAELASINKDANALILQEDAEAASEADALISAQLRNREEAAKTLASINKDANALILQQDEEAASEADALIMQQLKVREQELADEARLQLAAHTENVNVIKQSLSDAEAIEKAYFEKITQYETAQQKDNADILKKEYDDIAAMTKDADRIREESIEWRKKAEASVVAANKRMYDEDLDNFLAETKAKAKAAGGGGEATLSRGLRAGAGAAASMGGFQASGALYGAANVAQMAGVGDLALSTTALVGFGTALAGVGAAAYLVLGPGGEFNQELAKMSTLLVDSNVSADEFTNTLNKTKQAAIDVSDKFNVGLIDVVKDFKLALSSGIEANELPAFFEKAGELSNALGTDLEHTTDILTTFKNVYSLTASELEHVNDVLFNTINLGKIEVDGFTKNLGRVLPIAKNAGLGIEDLSTSYAVLTAKGVTAAQATTGLTQLISAVVNPTEKAQKEFDKLGIATGDAALRGRPFLEWLQEVKDKTGMSAEELGKLFPEERAKRVASFLVDNTTLFGKFSEGIKQSGTASVASGRAMDDLFDNLGKSWKTFWNSTVGMGATGAGWLNTVLYGAGTNSEKKGWADSEQMVFDDLGNVYRKMEANFKGSGLNNDHTTSQAFYRGVRKVMEEYLHNTGHGDTMANEDTITQVIKANWNTSGKPKAKSSDQIMDEANKSLNGINDYIDDIQRKVNDLTKSIGQMPTEAKMSKNENKEIAAKETDEQKQQLLDLHELNDEKQKQIASEVEINKIMMERQIATLEEFTVTKAMADLVEAKATNDPAKIQAATQALVDAKKALAEGSAKILEEGAADDVLTGLKAQSQGIIDEIAKIESDALTSPTTRKQREDAKTEAEKEVREYKDSLKQIYDDDVKAYEKSEKEKTKIQADAIKDMQKASDLYNNEESSITKAMLNSKLKTGDPDRQRYTAQEAKDAAKAKLESVVASGGDSDEFKKAMSEFKDAATAVQDAMIAAGYDKDRARKNFQGDLGYASEENSKYLGATDNAIDARTAAQQRAASYNRKSPEQMISEAKGEVKKDEAIKEVLVKAQVQLQVDGTLSPQTMKTLQDALLDQIDQRIMNKSGNPSRYDSSNRGPSTTAPSSTSSNFDSSNDAVGHGANSFGSGHDPVDYNPYSLAGD